MIDWLRSEIHALADGKIVGWQSDEWGDILVIDHGHLRLLTFDSMHEQSRLDKNQPTLLMHNYTRAMMLGLAFVKPKHITLLGLGGGCMLRTLHSLNLDVQMDVVELRQAVVDLARKFFDLPDSNKINITVADAKKYLNNQASATTDIIFSDMYHAWGIELFQTQKQFLNQAHRVLSTSGWLVINYHDKPDPDSPLFTWMTEIFKEILVCPVPYGNYIVFAGNCELSDSLKSYFHQIEPLQAFTKVKFEPLFKRLRRFNREKTLFQMIR